MEAVLASKSSLAAFITKLHSFPDDDYLTSLYAPNIKATVNDETYDMDAIKALIQTLGTHPKMTIDVLDLLREGRNFAWRHVGESSLPDGKTKKVQVFAFGELDADGRVVRQEESVVISMA